MGFVIQRDNEFFCCKVGRDFASPNGGWSTDKPSALHLLREKDAKEFMETYLRHDLAFCRVVPA